MSKESHVALSDNFFIGEEKQLKFTIVDADDNPIDMSSWTFQWVLAQEGDTSVLTVPTGDITTEDGTGTNDVAVVAIDRDNTLNLSPGVYKHTLWRTGEDVEQVLAFGDCYLRRHPDA